MAALHQVEAIATPNDSKEAPLVRRVIWSSGGDGGAGIGVSAGPGITVPIPAQQRPGRIIVPANPNPQPVNSNPQPVTPPVTAPATAPVTAPVTQPIPPPVTPPVTNDQAPDSTQEKLEVPQLEVDPNVSATRQIRLLSCLTWFYGRGDVYVIPPYCVPGEPAIKPGF